jgi:hypothetical protein
LTFGFVRSPSAAWAGEPKVELALVDGIVAFDGGANEFVFGARLSRAVLRHAVELDLGFVPRRGPEVLFWDINGVLDITRFRGVSRYPELSPFAIAGVGATTFLGDRSHTELSFNVGAGVKIYTSDRFGVRAEFRERFYWEANEPVLDLEVSGGVLLRL